MKSSPPVVNPGDGVQFLPPGPAPAVSGASVPAVWEQSAPAVPPAPAPFPSGKATLESESTPAESEGWQLRKEGWSLNEPVHVPSKDPDHLG
jgi:hypothetical protein